MNKKPTATTSKASQKDPIEGAQGAASSPIFGSTLGPIQQDAEMGRDCIPLPGGWELQTRGRGSTLRLADAKSGERHPLLEPDHVVDFIERMAGEVHRAHAAQEEALASARQELAALQEQMRQIVRATQAAGMTLLRTQQGHELRRLGRIEAQSEVDANAAVQAIKAKGPKDFDDFVDLDRTTSHAPPMTWPQSRDVARLHDMGPSGYLRVGLDSDNDVYVEVFDDERGQSASIEICNGGGGGGRSPQTRKALIGLMVAMEEDNAANPKLDWWALRNAPPSKKASP